MTARILTSALVAIGLWLAAVTASAQVGEGPVGPPAGLELSEVLALAEARNPMLRALRSQVDAVVARQAEASTLPDPLLQFGIMNFGVPDLNADMPTSMAPSVQFMQMVPFPGKLGLRGEIASYSSEMAEAGAREAWWEVRFESSMLFFELFSLDRRLEVMQRTLSLLHDFRDIANAMYVSGTGLQADVLRADVEIARMDADIERMDAMRRAQAARLNAVLNRPAQTEVPSPVFADLPLELPDRSVLLEWARALRPALEKGRLAVDQAGAQLDLARKEIWPDFSVGVAYGQRNRGLGTERMGSAMVEFSLPVHAGSRQYAARREAAAMQEMARSELVAAEASVDARIGVLLAELSRARRLTALYREEVIPESRATVESAFSSYRVGSVDFMTLVDAQMTLNQYEGELFELLGDYGTALAAMESEVGRPLPRTGPMLREQQ